MKRNDNSQNLSIVGKTCFLYDKKSMIKKTAVEI